MTQSIETLNIFHSSTMHSTDQRYNFYYSTENMPETNIRTAIKEIEDKLKNNDLAEVKEAPIVILKDNKPFKDNYRLLQQWEGVVLEVYDDYFLCRLHDMRDETPTEEAEIEFNEVSEGDIKLLQPGAIFYWNIGHYESESGQRTNSSMIIFRRMPAWSEMEIERSKKISEEICKKLAWGTNDNHKQVLSEGSK